MSLGESLNQLNESISRELAGLRADRDRLKAELAAMRKYIEEYRNVMDDMIQCDSEAGGLWLDAHCSFANEKAIELDAFLEKLATDAANG